MKAFFQMDFNQMKLSHLPMLSVTAIQNRRVICHWRCLTTLTTNNTIVAGSLPPVQALFSIRRRFVTLKALEVKTLTNNSVGLTNIPDRTDKSSLRGN